MPLEAELGPIDLASWTVNLFLSLGTPTRMKTIFPIVIINMPIWLDLEYLLLYNTQ